MKLTLKPLLMILLVGILMSVGCSALTWDMARKHADSLGPGVTVEGSNITLERTSEKTEIVVEAFDGKIARIEIREGLHIRTINDTSNIDFLRIGSRNKLEQETSVDQHGNINVFGKQTVAGLTVLNLILIIVAIVAGPLLIGLVLMIFPATMPIGLAIVGFYKLLIPSFSKPSTADTDEKSKKGP